MIIPLFEWILDKVAKKDEYFIDRSDAFSRLGVSGLQTVIAANLGESTANKSMNRFCLAIITCFGEELLKTPIASDIACLLAAYETREFPGMLKSIDCIH